MEPHMGRAVGSASLSAVESVISEVSGPGRGSLMSSWFLFNLEQGREDTHAHKENYVITCSPKPADVDYMMC